MREPGTDGVTDHGERDPRANQQAVTAHEAAAMVEGEEGAPKLFNSSAGFAETFAGGQVEDTDAGDGEDDQARDPRVACNVALVDASQEEAADHWGQEGKDGPELLGCRESGSGWLSDMAPTTIASRAKAMRV